MKNFEFDIYMDGHRPLTVDESDLKQICFEIVAELSEPNNHVAEEYRSNIDDLMKHYFTLKMVHTEFGKELTDEMIYIEGFIHNYLKRMYQDYTNQMYLQQDCKN